MRVAIITESFPPDVNGVANSVVRVAEHLHSRGHEPLVVAPLPAVGRRAITGKLPYPVVRVPSVPMPGYPNFRLGLPTRRIAAALLGHRAEVVHLASPFLLGSIGARVAARLGLPAVAVYQTDVAGFASSYGVGLTARAAWRWIRRLHSGAARTLAPSRWAVDALREHGVPRVHRWGRGVDTARFHPGRRDDDLRAELAPHGEMLVGYVGRLAAEKQVERLAALEGLPGVRVVVVGDGPSRARLGELLPSAHFLGFRGGTELARAYASFDAFVHTGPHETFCQTVQEALASGLPALAPDAGGPSDLIDDGRTGFLLPPWADDEFAAGLRRSIELLRDDATRAAFGAAARRSVQARTWPAICDELLGHYAELLDQPESRCA